MNLEPRRWTANPLVVAQSTESGLVLMDIATSDCYELNLVGAKIWAGLSKGETVLEIVASLSAEYGIPSEIAEVDVSALIADLSKHGLLTLTQQ
jgi:hypothetical protein